MERYQIEANFNFISHCSKGSGNVVFVAELMHFMLHLSNQEKKLSAPKPQAQHVPCCILCKHQETVENGQRSTES